MTQEKEERKNPCVNEQVIAGLLGLDGSEESLESHEGLLLSCPAKDEDTGCISSCFQSSWIESYPKHITCSASLG